MLHRRWKLKQVEPGPQVTGLLPGLAREHSSRRSWWWIRNQNDFRIDGKTLSSPDPPKSNISLKITNSRVTMSLFAAWLPDQFRSRMLYTRAYPLIIQDWALNWHQRTLLVGATAIGKFDLHWTLIQRWKTRTLHRNLTWGIQVFEPVLEQSFLSCVTGEILVKI